MFDSLIVRRCPQDGIDFDSGLIAEALLFYQNVHLLFDNSSLSGALRKIGPDILLRLLNDGWVKATYSPFMFATYSDNFPTHSIHNFSQIQITGSKERMFKRSEDAVVDLFEHVCGKSWATRRAAKKFIEKVSFKKKLATGLHPAGIPGLATEDIRDPHYVRDVIETVVRNRAPDYKLPARWYFELVFIDDKFVIQTNLNLTEINEVHKRQHSNSELTFPGMIGVVQEARADLTYAAEYMAEYVTNATQAEVMQRKISDLLRRRTQSQKEIEAFQEIAFQDGKAVGDAIRGDERSLSEFLDILERGAKFKSWLKGVNPDEGLVREYFHTATATTWVTSLPIKLFRFFTFTGGGMLADSITSSPLPSATFGAADAFLIERLFGGWKPHHFINKHLKPFVNG